MERQNTHHPKLIVGPCRSGTTILLQILSQAKVNAVYQSVKSGVRQNGKPDYSLFDEGTKDPNTITVAKETIGWKNTLECTYDVFPSDTAIQQSSPFFIFRDPVETWASWARNFDGATIQNFCTAYQWTLDTFHHAREVSSRTNLILHQDLVTDPESQLRRICIAWGIDFNPKMLQWEKPMELDNKVKFGPDIQKHINEGTFLGVNKQNAFNFKKNEPNLSLDETIEINQKFREQFEELSAI